MDKDWQQQGETTSRPMVDKANLTPQAKSLIDGGEAAKQGLNNESVSTKMPKITMPMLIGGMIFMSILVIAAIGATLFGTAQNPDDNPGELDDPVSVATDIDVEEVDTPEPIEVDPAIPFWEQVDYAKLLIDEGLIIEVEDPEQFNQQVLDDQLEVDLDGDGTTEMIVMLDSDTSSGVIGMVMIKEVYGAPLVVDVLDVHQGDASVNGDSLLVETSHFQFVDRECCGSLRLETSYTTEGNSGFMAEQTKVIEALNPAADTYSPVSFDFDLNNDFIDPCKRVIFRDILADGRQPGEYSDASNNCLNSWDIVDGDTTWEIDYTNKTAVARVDDTFTNVGANRSEFNCQQDKSQVLCNWSYDAGNVGRLVYNHGDISDVQAMRNVENFINNLESY